MLKWAVNGSHRQSQLQAIQIAADDRNNGSEKDHHDGGTSAELCGPKFDPRRSLNSANPCHIRREKLRRKSSGHELTNIRRKLLIADKENNLTSTPLPASRHIITSPLRKLDSLKDLSNIAPDGFLLGGGTPMNQTITNRSLRTPETNATITTITPHLAAHNSTLTKNNPLQYASTLPTFDVEYSPCGIIPGPILALRGVGVADSYFEKPRYLTHEFPGYRKRDDDLSSDILSMMPPAKRFHSEDSKTLIGNDEESLSSSKMGDTTLDKMIDAILESARKERRNPKSSSKQTHIMSPTYTPADDPASDLNEFWDSRSSKYRQSETRIKNVNLGDPGGTFNEREIRTPDNYLDNLIMNFPSAAKTIGADSAVPSGSVNESEMSCHLRRQRAVRRKRKLTSTNFIKSTVKQSAQKLFTGHNMKLRKSLDNNFVSVPPDQQPHKITSARNLSPDSGRNSASDFEDSNTADDGNFTKRRLSFSPPPA